MIRTQNGFTVVELLVVIAVIAVLTSVILPRLQTARDGGIEAKIKTEMTIIGKRALVEENEELTYDVVCGTNGYPQAKSILDQIQSIENFTGETVVCNSNPNNYAVSVRIASSTHWCVDSESVKIERPTGLGGSEFTCE
jgi:prepilin-type N-terminal cleavage/methylation domain-containing protein